MRASERCQSHFQGDRCKKAKSHEFSTAMDPDPVHLGNFTAWNQAGQPVARLQNKAPKRNRRVNRMIRTLGASEVIASQIGRKPMIAMLEGVIKYLRGGTA